jgi:hypothetical protein
VCRASPGWQWIGRGLAVGSFIQVAVRSFAAWQRILPGCWSRRAWPADAPQPRGGVASAAVELGLPAVGLGVGPTQVSPVSTGLVAGPCEAGSLSVSGNGHRCVSGAVPRGAAQGRVGRAHGDGLRSVQTEYCLYV